MCACVAVLPLGFVEDYPDPKKAPKGLVSEAALSSVPAAGSRVSKL
jgi:hypothetical protein